MPRNKENAVFSVDVQTDFNVYAFEGSELKKYRELHALKVQQYSIDNSEPDWEQKRKDIDEKYKKKKAEAAAAFESSRSLIGAFEPDWEQKRKDIDEKYEKAKAEAAEALEAKKSAVDNSGADWQQKRKEADEEYEKKKAEAARTFEEQQQTIKNAAEQEAFSVRGKVRSSEAIRISASEEAKLKFPLPRIVLRFNGGNDASFSLGKNQNETEDRIDRLAKSSVSTSSSLAESGASVTETAIIFSKVDKRAISYIRNDVWMRRGRPVARSEEFIAMQNSIRDFYDEFMGENALNEGDYLSFTNRLRLMRSKLEAIADSSMAYIDTHRGWRGTEAGKQRVQMAKNAYAMALSKMQAIETALVNAAGADIDQAEQRDRFVSEKVILEKLADVEKLKPELDEVEKKRKADLESAESAYQKTLDDLQAEHLDKLARKREEYLNEAESAYQKTLDDLKTEHLNEIEELARKREADKEKRENNLKRAENRYKSELADQAIYRDIEIDKLEQAQRDFRKKAANAGNVISSGSSFTLTDHVAYETLSPEQQFAVNSAKFSGLLFEEKHNPFAAYKSTVPLDAAQGEIAVDKAALKDALPLKDLKAALKSGASDLAVTYNVDALITLANLQLYDTITGVARETNDYKVRCEFVKDGERLPASALKDKGAEALAKEGYVCFVTGIMADPIMLKEGNYGPGRGFTLKERSVIPLETARKISLLDTAYVKAVGFEDPDRSKDGPAEVLGNAFDQLKSEISLRKGDVMLKDSHDAWKKFNVVSEKRLKKSIASDSLDFRPTRPSKRLKEKKYFRSGVVEAGGNYFDESLMKNLSKNVIAVSDPKYVFDSEFSGKLLSKEMLTISGRTTAVSGEELGTKAVAELIVQLSKDPQLAGIAELMTGVADMGVKDVLSYDKRYLDEEANVISDPGRDYYSIETASCENHYDQKASELYAQVLQYIRGHEGDLSDPQSPAYVLKQWKDSVYPRSSSVFDEKDRNCKFIDAGSSVESDSLEVFNGDGDYLCGAKLSFDDNGYWDSGSDDMDSIFHTDRREIYMKDFTDAPLFTREPSLTDLRQGEIGNCYFLAYISSAIESDPSSIKDMIHDNDDGTVTCKFFNEHNQPTYVRINKTVPYVRHAEKGDKIFDIPCSGERSPLWFHLLQKGYILAGMRTVKDLSPKDLEKTMKSFNENAGGDESDVPDKVKENILNMRFGSSGEKGRELIKGGSDVLYNRIICHSLKIMEGGLNEKTYKHFTGKKAREKRLNTPDGKKTIEALRDIVPESNCFCGNRLKNAFGPEDAGLFRDMCREAAERLILEKTSYSADIGGTPFVQIEKINMDELLDTMKAVAAEPVGENLRGKSPEKRAELFARFSDAMTDYQMNEPSPDAVFVSHRSGKYSAAAENVFKVIKGHLAKKHGIICDFHALDNKVADEDDLNLPMAAESASEDGMVSGHDFSIIGCKTENGKKILYVRNPWGRSERLRHVAAFRGADGKEDIAYADRSLNEDENSMYKGVFEVELNEFMEYGKDISFLTNEHSLNHDDVVDELSTRYLEQFKAQNPQQYEAVIKANGYKKVFEKTQKSDVIQKYAADVFKIDDITSALEDGRKVDASKLRELDKLKSELSSFFAAKPVKGEKLVNEAAPKEPEAVKKGGALA